MGIASGDPDGDGDEDLFVTNLVGETFVLYRNDGRGNFEDVRVEAGLSAPTAAFTGFGTDWFDYDNDGWLDLFVANGAVNVIEALRGQPSPFRMRNQLFRNTGGGRFVETSAAAGPELARAGSRPRRGLRRHRQRRRHRHRRHLQRRPRAAADQSAHPGSAGTPPRGANHWLQVATVQAEGNRFGFGARVGVERAGQPTLWRRVKTDGSYLSASDPRVHFGLGPSAALDAIVVQWPDGQRERWTGLAADRLITLRRGTGKP